jgi:hypothetical protein
MVDRTAFAQGNTDHAAFSLFGGFLDCIRHFACFCVTMTNAAFAIANHDQSCEAETTATFHNFGNAVYGNQAFADFRVFAFFARFTIWTSHV